MGFAKSPKKYFVPPIIYLTKIYESFCIVVWKF